MEEPLIRTLEEQIAEKIKNYRRGTGVYDAEHVDRWISQFPEEERMVVLTETNRLLEQNYVDQAKLMEWERYIETNADIMGADPQKTISKSQFLDIQTKGNSQKRLVPMVESYLQACGYTGVNTCAPGEVANYFYLDDCLFTGMTLLKDVGHWLETENPNPGSTLKIIYIAGYNGALSYVKKRLEEICAPKHIKAKIHLMREYKNDMRQPQPYDILWPRTVKGDPYVDQYMAHLEELKASSGRSGIGFRKGYSDGESELFTSGYNRYVLEQALMKKGAYICSLSENGNDKMKPMGYKHDISLGFGAFFATDYNISNNCPLAFWWGSTEKTGTVLEQWYPLLPREVNVKTMPIEYIQDAEKVPEELCEKLKGMHYSSFSFEQRQWAIEPLIKNGAWNFVGVMRVDEQVFLCLPKSVSVRNGESQEEKEQRLLKYARLLEQYFQEVKKCSEDINFVPIYPWCVDTLVSWCEIRNPWSREQKDVGVIAAVKFEKVFEWLIGWLYRNQLHLSGNDVLYDSFILRREDLHINHPAYNIYEWEPVNKRKEDRTLENRRIVFEDMEKKSIPDIVIDMSAGDQELCCILDAKYSGWKDNGYKLPGRMDIYKQFFYQEQIKRIYENTVLKRTDKTEVYNFLVLPDYIGDTKDGITRYCAKIKFYYHEDREMGVIQVNLENLITAFLEEDEGEQERQSGYLKMFCARINPFLG